MTNLRAGPLANVSNPMMQRRLPGEISQAQPGEAERVSRLH
jgi:hypothetical protein